MYSIFFLSIEATDLAGNYTEYSCYENGEYKYWVSVEPQASEEIHIKKFELKQNGQTLNEGFTIEGTVFLTLYKNSPIPAISRLSSFPNAPFFI